MSHMSQTTISVRTDDRTKQEINEFAQKLGLSVSSLIIAAMKQVIRENRINLSPNPLGNYDSLLQEIALNTSLRKQVLQIAQRAELRAALEAKRLY